MSDELKKKEKEKGKREGWRGGKSAWKTRVEKEKKVWWREKKQTFGIQIFNSRWALGALFWGVLENCLKCARYFNSESTTQIVEISAPSVE